MFIAGKHVNVTAADDGLTVETRTGGQVIRLNPEQTEEFIIMTEMLKAGAGIHVHVGPARAVEQPDPLPAAGYN